MKLLFRILIFFFCDDYCDDYHPQRLWQIVGKVKKVACFFKMSTHSPRQSIEYIYHSLLYLISHLHKMEIQLDLWSEIKLVKLCPAMTVFQWMFEFDWESDIIIFVFLFCCYDVCLDEMCLLSGTFWHFLSFLMLFLTPSHANCWEYQETGGASFTQPLWT